VNRNRALRRRVIAAILLLLSVGMLTLFFRQPTNSALHTAQDAAMRVVRPLQAGTARVTKPFRDAWNWFGDLFAAKAQNKRLQKENTQLQQGVSNAAALKDQNDQLLGLLGYKNGKIFPAGVRLATSRVIARSTSAWVSTVTIDLGSDDGVKLYDAVVNAQGLVGRVSAVRTHDSSVQLITDQQSFVDAVAEKGGAQGVLAGSVTGDLTLDYVDKSEKVQVGSYVLTSGMKGSVFVKGIPIGIVTQVGQQDVELFQSISVSPFVDFHRLDLVMVVLQ
jgi:rod shape-determining protein MreC